MTTLYLQEEIFSFDHFDIWDEAGNVLYQVEREFFHFGKKLIVLDAGGRQLASIQHIPFSIPCSYELCLPGQTLALDRLFALFRKRYVIDALGWEVEGDFMSLSFFISQNGRTVASIEKAWPAFHDRYRLAVDDSADTLAALCVVLAIDCCDEHDS